MASAMVFKLGQHWTESSNPMKSYEVLRKVLQKGNAKQIAADMGLSLSLIYKWAEPADAGSGAANPLDRIEALIRIDPSILEWLCERAGGHFTKREAANVGAATEPGDKFIQPNFGAWKMEAA